MARLRKAARTTPCAHCKLLMLEAASTIRRLVMDRRIANDAEARAARRAAQNTGEWGKP